MRTRDGEEGVLDLTCNLHPQSLLVRVVQVDELAEEEHDPSPPERDQESIDTHDRACRRLQERPETVQLPPQGSTMAKDLCNMLRAMSGQGACL